MLVSSPRFYQIENPKMGRGNVKSDKAFAVCHPCSGSSNCTHPPTHPVSSSPLTTAVIMWFQLGQSHSFCLELKLQYGSGDTQGQQVVKDGFSIWCRRCHGSWGVISCIYLTTYSFPTQSSPKGNSSSHSSNVGSEQNLPWSPGLFA